MSDAWIGVIGTAIGIVLGFLGSYLNDRRRMAREDRFRFADEKKAAYVAFTTAARGMALAGYDFVNDKAPIPDEPIAELGRTAAEISFIAPSDIRNIADEIAKQATEVVRLAREYGERGDELLLPRVAIALNLWDDAMRRFKEQARLDLGV